MIQNIAKKVSQTRATIKIRVNNKPKYCAFVRSDNIVLTLQLLYFCETLQYFVRAVVVPNLFDRNVLRSQHPLLTFGRPKVKILFCEQSTFRSNKVGTTTAQMKQCKFSQKYNNYSAITIFSGRTKTQYFGLLFTRTLIVARVCDTAFAMSNIILCLQGTLFALLLFLHCLT